MVRFLLPKRVKYELDEQSLIVTFKKEKLAFPLDKINLIGKYYLRFSWGWHIIFETVNGERIICLMALKQEAFLKEFVRRAEKAKYDEKIVGSYYYGLLSFFFMTFSYLVIVLNWVVLSDPDLSTAGVLLTTIILYLTYIFLFSAHALRWAHKKEDLPLKKILSAIWFFPIFGMFVVNRYFNNFRSSPIFSGSSPEEG